jgi:hypothetical protein
MSRPFEPLHQPPSAADLTQHPPDGPECARVRGLLRDCADGDLSPADARAVAEHVHECRTCSVALGRAEHEVLLLRRAFQPLGQPECQPAGQPEGADAPEVSERERALGGREDASRAGGATVSARAGGPAMPRPGFARRTVERLLADASVPFDFASGDSASGDPANGDPANAEAGADGSGGGSVLADKRASGSAVAAASAAGALPAQGAGSSGWGWSAWVARAEHAAPWTIAGALTVVIGMLGSTMLLEHAPVSEAVARFSVIKAIDSYYRDNGVLLPLRSGAGFGEGVAFVVKAGSTTFDCSDTVRGTQPAAQVTLRGDSEVRLRGGSPLLVEGTMEVKSHRPMVINLGDGARVELSAGLYHFDVMPALAFDTAVSAAERELSVRIEVIDGGTAKIVREVEPTDVTLAVGQVGRYRGSSAMHVDPMDPGALSSQAGSSRQAAPQPPVEAPDFSGYVFTRPQGTPSAGSRATISYLNAQGLTLVNLLSDVDGRFEIAAGSGLRGDVVVLRVQPPVGRSDLGVSVSDAYPLLRSGAGTNLQQLLPLDPSPLVSGVVVDTAGRGLFGVRVVPCLYDSVLGLVLPWTDISASTQADGSFQLQGLPTSAPVHQTVGIIALDTERQPTFTPLPLPGSAAFWSLTIRIELPPRREVDLRNLPPNSVCEIIEELPGLPSGWGAQVYTVHTNGSGRYNDLRCGSGALWLRAGTPSHPQLRSIQSTHSGSSWAPTNDTRDPALVFRLMTSVSSTPFWLASGYRHEFFRAERGDAPELTVNDRDAVARVAGAQVFALRPGIGVPQVRFLGIQDGGTTLRADVDVCEQELVAIGRDGAVARAPVQSLMLSGARVQPMLMAASGRVLVGEALRPASGVLPLRFEPHETSVFGTRPPMFRFATAAEGWVLSGVPAGDYTVRDPQMHPFVITVPANGQALLH